MKEDTLFKETPIDNLQSIRIETRHFKVGCLQISWKNLTGTIDAEYYLEGSNDAETWDVLSSPSVMSEAESCDLIMFSEIFCKYIRCRIYKKGVTGGSVSAVLTLKV